MGATVWGRHGVAIRVEKSVFARDPGDRPFHRAVAFALITPAGEDLLGDRLLPLDAARQKILKPAREVEDRALRRLLVACEQRSGARPADLDAAEEVGLGARHAEQPRRCESSALAEDLCIRLEADRGAAAVLHRAETFQRAVWMSAGISLPVELLPARHLDFEVL